MKHDEHGVPPHESGIKISAENTIELENEDKAKAFFEIMSRKLLDVNHWHKMAGEAGATFQLVDSSGTEVDRSAQQGDYFKIDIPGPGPVAGKGYDWAHVEEISKKEDAHAQSLAIRVRPAPDPKGTSGDVAHFYDPEATSTFKITRDNRRVKASIHDRNTKANTSSGSVIDKVRNTAVAAGALAAFSKVQWQKLVDGILEQTT